MGMEEYVYKDRLPSTREERTAKKGEGPLGCGGKPYRAQESR
jgi:hypothetical protein